MPYGKMQNNNEGINSIIQKHCLKDTYVGMTVLEIGTTSANIDFNYGIIGMLRVLGKLDMIILQGIFQKGRTWVRFEKNGIF